MPSAAQLSRVTRLCTKTATSAIQPVMCSGKWAAHSKFWRVCLNARKVSSPASPAAPVCPKLSEIAAQHNVNYLPIISSARAFRALWKRAYPGLLTLWGLWSMKIRGSLAVIMTLSNAEDPRGYEPLSTREGAAH